MFFLMLEYKAVRYQIKKIVQMKKMYKEYALIYKRKLELVHHTTSHEAAVLPQNMSFPLINRNEHYLSENAIAFARKYNLETPVRKLYLESDYTLLPKQNEPRKKRINRPKNKINIYQTAKRGDYLLQWPIEQNRFWMSSKFGPRRRKKNNKTTAWKFHYGIDLAAIKGTPVHAAASGRVTEVAYSKKGYGKTIVINHSHCQTRYAHLDGIYVKLGENVQSGQVIATVGNSGFVLSKHGVNNASHLHFEVKEAGNHIDPLLVLA